MEAARHIERETCIVYIECAKKNIIFSAAFLATRGFSRLHLFAKRERESVYVQVYIYPDRYNERRTFTCAAVYQIARSCAHATRMTGEAKWSGEPSIINPARKHVRSLVWNGVKMGLLVPRESL